MEPTTGTGSDRARRGTSAAPPGGSARPMATLSGSWVIAVGGACGLIGAILLADTIEGPKTAYVGVLTAVPLFAAIFGTARQTAVAAIITWMSAFAFGHLASDGNVTAQSVRLWIIAGAGLLATAAAQSRVKREIALVRAELAAAEADLFREHAHHDELTGLLNRRGLIEATRTLPAEPRTVVLVDCDHFKDINDTYGHSVGDDLLQGIAGRLRSNVAASDLVARWGGDEFLLVVQAPIETGREVAERLQSLVRAEPVTTRSGLLPIAMCMGAAAWSGPEELDAALADADRELYLAKSQRPPA